MRRTYGYVGMTEDEAQRSRWTFYEVVNFDIRHLLDLQALICGIFPFDCATTLIMN